MKFRNEKIELGTRFYTFISEDEYRIVTFVKDNNNKSGQFMDEETFELETITEDKLFDKFTLLADNSLWIICNFKTKDEFKNEDDRLWLYNKNESFWLYNDDISNFLNNQIISYPYEVKIKLRLVIYKFMKASVFNKLINYIIKLNAPKFEISNDDIDSIWKEYFRFISNSNTIIDLSSEANRINMDDVVNNKAKIPDDVLDYAEEILNVPILTYDPYEYDDSINMDNVNLKYFFIYTTDKYYLILYVVHTMTSTVQSRQNLQDHMDIVQFMLK